DLGYLWTSTPPVPFLLPLAFPGGARWNYWYGTDGPPPPVTWRLRDGGHGLAGFVAHWDADPGVTAGRTLATSGSAAVPGPGAHTPRRRDGINPGQYRLAGHRRGPRGAGRTAGPAEWDGDHHGRPPGTPIRRGCAGTRHRCLAAWIGWKWIDTQRRADVSGIRCRRRHPAFRAASPAGRRDHLEQRRSGGPTIFRQGT